MTSWHYPPGASDDERDRIDQAAADHGQARRDGAHEDHR